jgi:hypothetical protein
VTADSHVRLTGVAGVAGGLGWTALVTLRFADDRGATLLGYGTLDLLTPVALGLVAVAVLGYRSRTRSAWSRLVVAGFAVFAAGLLGALAGAATYVGAGYLTGWTVSVWSYAVALVGATGFGAGLLVAGVPPRAGAALLAGTLPVGLVASLSLAVGGVVPDEAVVPLGPGVLLGVGVAVLGWWVTTGSSTASERT